MRVLGYLTLAVLLPSTADLRSQSSSAFEEVRIFRTVETVILRGSAAAAKCP
jgi:hypothetical protein